MSKDQMLAELENCLDSTASLETAARKRWRDLKKKHASTPVGNEDERAELWKKVKASRAVQRR